MAAKDPCIGKRDSWRGDLVELHTAQSPLPTLYHAEPSYYSQVVRLVMEEEGINYISRETDIHSKQEQSSDWYLNMNPAGVVPTLLWAGKPVCESKDISIFVVDNLSHNDNGLLSVNRDDVLEMVEFHYEQCLIEPLTFSTLASKNKFMATIINKKMSGGLAKLEKSKIANPDLSSELDKKIAALKERMKIFQDPQKTQDEALAKMMTVLDRLEERLGRAQFVCGETYSLADCLYTCTLARLAMVGLLDNLLTQRPRLARWWAAVQVRQSFKKAGIVSFGLGQVLIKRMCVIL